MPGTAEHASSAPGMDEVASIASRKSRPKLREGGWPSRSKSPFVGDEAIGVQEPPLDHVPMSFKRRLRDPSAGLSSVRSWISDASFRPTPALPGRYRMSGVPDGWEHPARYVNASHMTVPSIFPTRQAPPTSNPLPMLPYTVLCLLIFGEFCSAGVAGPFLFFMLDDFQLGDESTVGFWAGIVASIFFFSQFLTSLLWSSAADKYGRRLVLQVSLIGNTLSLLAFGMATNLPMVLFFRFAQGLFNGAVGVAKGAIRDLTDETNEARAYAQMGFWWGMGGIIGPIIGGVMEHPVTKFPWLFGQSAWLTQYPYFLPCAMAAMSTATGAVLSLFLEPHAGARSGAIRLDNEDASTPDYEEDGEEHSALFGRSDWSMSSSLRSRGRRRTIDPLRWSHLSIAHRLSTPGSAYGYHSDLGSTSRVGSVGPHSEMAGSADGTTDIDAARLSLVERFVLANDDAVLGITDLWVAAASNAEDVTEEDTSAIEEVDEEDEESQSSVPEDSEAPPLFASTTSESTMSRAPSSLYVPPMHYARQKMQRMRSAASLTDSTEELSSRQELSADEGAAPVAMVSPLRLVPLAIIGHYGLLALHSALFDQVFMAFLVTPVPSGGLGLTAGHFATLIAIMTVCQLVFQFHVYPNLGPPNGKLTHLEVMRWGMLLYLPCYLLFPFLRTFLHPSTNVFVMLAMILCAALRWLANILSFTAVMVLLNAWTPIHLVPLANGLAQTMSSFTRCMGPILGGIVWAQSIQGGPTAHAWPLNYHLGFIVAATIALVGALHARWMREITL